MKFFIRADSSSTIGTGHIFRTLAFARQLKNHGHSFIYLCRALDHSLAARIETEGGEVIPLPDIVPFSQEKEIVLQAVKIHQPDWIIIDHYEVKEDYYRALRDTGVKILAIDDINHTVFPVDVLLNQNISSEQYCYECLPETV